ncbi:MarR family winged helix-turn-helix transcriptional regulator [Streptomyces phyllanthi]|uniref:MarR family transcriptional regulator n=1 Tax=Streptomyces phyllanthi TaxID=1803180 RepID=A0A5N8WDN7_9ACTN|nr:MarR family transcriptional regulator [Streptomyces phyllanthi]MPY45581.1 MarR family transcriptional regulator [Streptomyces phyllanthi]
MTRGRPVGEAAGREPGTRERQGLLSRTALTVFRLNGQFLSVADELARPAGLTAAWWQVLGAVLHEPLTVSGIARAMGITRQSVQRVADLLVDRGLAEYLPNPAHRRARLVTPTATGRAAIAEIDPGHATLADRLAKALGEREFAETARVLERLSEALDEIASPDPDTPDRRF